jgi:hypothetical protein
MPNHVWSTDITYLPMRGGFLYLVAVMGWFSRFVLSWELSNTMETGFCLAALDAALASPKSGTPIRARSSPPCEHLRTTGRLQSHNRNNLPLKESAGCSTGVWVGQQAEYCPNLLDQINLPLPGSYRTI